MFLVTTINADLPATRRVLEEVRWERERQDEKWGESNHDHSVWSLILAEEVGEAARAALRLRFDSSSQAGLATQNEETLREELIQAAAVAVAWIEAIDRRRGRCICEEPVLPVTGSPGCPTCA
jgi:NTP pyrophosphatase (non-canonical NTP hydrolase)